MGFPASFSPPVLPETLSVKDAVSHHRNFSKFLQISPADATRPHLPPNMEWGGLSLPWKEDDGVGGATSQGSIPGQHPCLSLAPCGKRCYSPTPSKTIRCRASPSQLPQQLGVFFSSLDARFSMLLRASRCPSPRWQAGGKLAKALLTQAVLPDFRGERFFVKGLLGWVNHPLIVTFEVLLKLERDDRTDVE